MPRKMGSATSSGGTRETPLLIYTVLLMPDEPQDIKAKEGASTDEGQSSRQDRGELSPNPEENANPAFRELEDKPAPAAGTFGGRAIAALLAWGLLVLAFSVGGLADVTSFWWVLPAFGFAAPVVLLLALRARTAPDPAVSDALAGAKERELLGALQERRELTPTGAAMRTTLTVAEAAAILEDLAQEGHLEARARDGSLVYALREHDLRGPEGDPEADVLAEVHRPEEPASEPGTNAPAEPSEGSPAGPPIEPAVEPLAEPLSAREREVLGLLSSGKTNREIAAELYVSPGTVKAHVANIYRKLEVHNRTEALGRARAVGLLDR